MQIIEHISISPATALDSGEPCICDCTTSQQDSGETSRVDLSSPVESRELVSSLFFQRFALAVTQLWPLNSVDFS